MTHTFKYIYSKLHINFFFPVIINIIENDSIVQKLSAKAKNKTKTICVDNVLSTSEKIGRVFILLCCNIALKNILYLENFKYILYFPF